MVRITKVYTKMGDQGKTRLAGGQSIDKTAQRIEAFGTVDELNSQLGMVAESLRDIDIFKNLHKQILVIQNKLFDLGAQLSVLPEDLRENTPSISQDDILRLENEIDTMNQSLPSLKSFILPGGGEISARLHVARTVCRRAEREIIRLADEAPLGNTEIPYLNRLSDWLFVACRFVSQQQGIAETLWKSVS